MGHCFNLSLLFLPLDLCQPQFNSQIILPLYYKVGHRFCSQTKCCRNRERERERTASWMWNKTSKLSPFSSQELRGSWSSGQHEIIASCTVTIAMVVEPLLGGEFHWSLPWEHGHSHSLFADIMRLSSQTSAEKFLSTEDGS